MNESTDSEENSWPSKAPWMAGVVAVVVANVFSSFTEGWDRKAEAAGLVSLVALVYLGAELFVNRLKNWPDILGIIVVCVMQVATVYSMAGEQNPDSRWLIPGWIVAALVITGLGTLAASRKSESRFLLGVVFANVLIVFALR